MIGRFSGQTTGHQVNEFDRGLDAIWRNLLVEGNAASTMRQYASKQKRFINFCALLGVSVCPVDETVLLRFVAALSSSHCGSTIHNYLSAIRSLHIMNGYPCQFSEFERLKLAVKALKRRSGPQRKRAPVTVRMLADICRILDFKTYEDALLWAMLTMAFFGFLRVSEFTTDGQFNPMYHLLREDLRFLADFSSMFIKIKASKTDPFRQGCRIVLGATGDCLCPVLAMSLYLSMSRSSEGPLFKLLDSRPVSRSWFCSRLQEMVRRIGAEGDFTSHSLRIGAATRAAEVGLSSALIQILGRWRSDSFKLYVRMSDSQKASVASKLTLSFL